MRVDEGNLLLVMGGVERYIFTSSKQPVAPVVQLVTSKPTDDVGT